MNFGVFVFSTLETGLSDLTYYFLYSAFSIVSFSLALIRNKKNRSTPAIFAILLGVFLAVLFSRSYSVDPSATRIGSIQVFSALLIFYSTYYGLNSRNKEALLKILIAYSVFLALWGIWQSFAGMGNFRVRNIARAHSVFMTPNIFAGYCCIFLIPSVYFYYRSSCRKEKLCFCISSCVLFAGIICSLSRSAVILLAGTVCLMFLDYFIKHYLIRTEASFVSLKRITMMGVFLFVTAALILSLLHLSNRTYVKNRVISLVIPQKDNSFKDRILYWKSAMRLAEDFFPLGCGYEAFATIYPWYKNPVFQKVTHFFVHNDYIQYVAEMGIGGLLLLLLLYLSIWIKTFKNRGTAKILGFSCVFLTLFSSVEYVMYLPSFVFCMVFFASFLIPVPPEGTEARKNRFYMFFNIFFVVCIMFNMIFMCRLFMAEYSVKKARYFTEQDDWEKGLEAMRYAEGMIPDNMTYKLNTFIISGKIYERTKRKEMADTAIASFKSIIALSRYNKRALLICNDFFGIFEKDFPEFSLYYTLSKNIVDENEKRINKTSK
jgi:O-antigen ligase